jgi:hypothetical protein
MRCVVVAAANSPWLYFFWNARIVIVLFATCPSWESGTGNMDPMYDCNVGTKCPIVGVRYDQPHLIGFGDEGRGALSLLDHHFPLLPSLQVP